MVYIPKGSKSIIINNDNNLNFLAIKNNNGTYYLNGEFTVESNIIGKIESISLF